MQRYLYFYFFLLEIKHHEHQSDGVQDNGSRMMRFNVQLNFPGPIAHLSYDGPLYRNTLKILSRQVEEVHSCKNCDWDSFLGGGDCSKSPCTTPFCNDIRK